MDVKMVEAAEAAQSAGRKLLDVDGGGRVLIWTCASLVGIEAAKAELLRVTPAQREAALQFGNALRNWLNLQKEQEEQEEKAL